MSRGIRRAALRPHAVVPQRGSGRGRHFSHSCRKRDLVLLSTFDEPGAGRGQFGAEPRCRRRGHEQQVPRPPAAADDTADAPAALIPGNDPGMAHDRNRSRCASLSSGRDSPSGVRPPRSRPPAPPSRPGISARPGTGARTRRSRRTARSASIRASTRSASTCRPEAFAKSRAWRGSAAQTSKPRSRGERRRPPCMRPVASAATLSAECLRRKPPTARKPERPFSNVSPTPATRTSKKSLPASIPALAPVMSPCSSARDDSDLDPGIHPGRRGRGGRADEWREIVEDFGRAGAAAAARRRAQKISSIR